MKNQKKLGQMAFEYIIIMGFVTFVLTTIIGIAFIQSGNINNQLKITQMTNCVNKIISTSEQVFYAGEPSKATITCYLPDNIQNMEILENSLVVTFQTTNGENIIAFDSNVPISNGTLSFNQDLNKFQITAQENYAEIARV